MRGRSRARIIHLRPGARLARHGLPSWRALLAINVALAAICVGLFLGYEPVASTSSAPIVGQASIIDGDTIRLVGERIRLHGIDAPETAQLCRDKYGFTYACGASARAALSDKIGMAAVQCEGRGFDRYGRTIGVCRVDGGDLSAWLVRNGWAVAYLDYGGWAYAVAEIEARIGQRGIWAGEFTRPDKWRHSH
jgi:endonuclease YncB( thermonuclease family)